MTVGQNLIKPRSTLMHYPNCSTVKNDVRKLNAIIAKNFSLAI